MERSFASQIGGAVIRGLQMSKNVPPANIELRFRDDPFIANVVVYGEAKKFLVAWLGKSA